MPAPATCREVTVILQDHEGTILGALPQITISVPWLQETGDVVEGVKKAFGIQVWITRIVDARRDGDRVIATYLADYESGNLPALDATDIEFSKDPLRLPYAVPGGARAELDWATEQLATLGYHLREARQVRTWNLSSIWCLDCGDTRYWLKTVPPFFAHEGPLIRLLQDEKVPRLVHHDGCRSLLAELPGKDLYDAGLPLKLLMVEQLVDLQWRWSQRLPELFNTGIPDHQGENLLMLIDRALETTLTALTQEQRILLVNFRKELPGHLGTLQACGLPVTLVHGDYHPGNWRGNAREAAVLDWGDATIGHPMLDIPPLLNTIAESDRPAVIERWRTAWLKWIPDADIDHAITLIRPIAALRLAGIYQMFLDNIAKSEHVYHREDPFIMLGHACRILADRDAF